jgi:bacterioferritin-associated ferredoxin
MKAVKICPDCGQPTMKVKEDAVKHHAEISKTDKFKWQVCVNPSCETVYISDQKSIRKAGLNYRIFFKETTPLTPVCYCAGINREDISLAVDSGCKSISQIRKFSGKTKKGSCKCNNPLGKSCNEYFNNVLNQYLVKYEDKLKT